jgi:type I restriction enzyme M protein
MVWGAKKGWYKEEPDQNILRPQDVMRLLVQLESYGDKSEAERIIPVEEARLFQLVDDNLAYKELEINDNYKEEQEEWIKTDALFRCMAELSETEQTLTFTTTNDIIVNCKVKHGKFDFLPNEEGSQKLPLGEKSMLRLKIENGAVLELKVKADNKAAISKADLEKVTKRLAKLTEILQKRDKSLADARLEAIREKEAIQKVSAELLIVFDHPELRKSYFSLVEIDEIIENEYNLNLPRYIDTVEPEEEIPVEVAVSELEAALINEKAAETKLNKYLKVLVNAD